MKIQKNKAKIEIFLSQLLIIKDIEDLPIDICFEDDKKDEISKKITHHQRCQNPRWPPIMDKELLLVYKVNWYAIPDIALIVPKQKCFRSNEY